jgi:hypothetical protein
MLTPTRGLSLDALTAISNPNSLSRANANQSNGSFGQQLAASLESYLNGASAGSHLEIDILPPQAGNAGARQFLVTVTGPDSPASTATVSTPPVSPLFAQAPVADAAEGSGTTPPVQNPPITNEVDAYWSTQPEEVQVLRTIDDPTERAEMGQKLANQGFVIDPNIMIHRWDPYMTMKIRQGEGYTWTPAVGQNGIPVSPGLNFPGLPSYDPNNPPPGAVRVTTDFAIGLENTSPGAGNTNFNHNPLS